MTYVFRDSPTAMMASFFQYLDLATEHSPKSDGYFRTALVTLVGLHDRQAKVGPVQPDQLERFLIESGSALSTLNGQLGAYVEKALYMAEGANDNEWPELCLRRSVIQILIDNYADTQVAALIDREVVADLDLEMRRVGNEQGPLSESEVPAGLPNSHWWWQYP